MSYINQILFDIIYFTGQSGRIFKWQQSISDSILIPVEVIYIEFCKVCKCLLHIYDFFFSSKFQLPKDRKLKLLQDQPVKKLSKLSSGNRDTRDKYLILWMFEVKLKELYKKFLTNLAEVSKDTIEKTRMKVMSVNLELLVQSPEQEQELLSRYIFFYTCKIFRIPENQIL